MPEGSWHPAETVRPVWWPVPVPARTWTTSGGYPYRRRQRAWGWGQLALLPQRPRRHERHESQRSRRREAIRALRAQGRYGPALHEVLPALFLVVLVVCGIVAGLAVAYRTLGTGALAGGLVLLAVITAAVIRHNRPLARRRLGYYTPDEIADLDVEGLALAVSRMLRRDGWRAQARPDAQGLPRVRARTGSVTGWTWPSGRSPNRCPARRHRHAPPVRPAKDRTSGSSSTGAPSAGVTSSGRDGRAASS